MPLPLRANVTLSARLLNVGILAPEILMPVAVVLFVVKLSPSFMTTAVTLSALTRKPLESEPKSIFKKT